MQTGDPQQYGARLVLRSHVRSAVVVHTASRSLSTLVVSAYVAVTSNPPPPVSSAAESSPPWLVRAVEFAEERKAETTAVTSMGAPAAAALILFDEPAREPAEHLRHRLDGASAPRAL